MISRFKLLDAMVEALLKGAYQQTHTMHFRDAVEYAEWREECEEAAFAGLKTVLRDFDDGFMLTIQGHGRIICAHFYFYKER